MKKTWMQFAASEVWIKNGTDQTLSPSIAEMQTLYISANKYFVYFKIASLAKIGWC